MRKLLILALFAAAAGAVVVVELPERQAEAEGHASKPQEIESIAFDGKDLPVAQLRSVLHSHTGDQVSAPALTADRSSLEATLVALGYLDAKVAAAQVTYDAAGGAFVTFAVHRGPLFHVREVHVTGAEASIVTLTRGEPVQADRIERARDALATRQLARGGRSNVVVTLQRDATDVDVTLAAK